MIWVNFGRCGPSVLEIRMVLWSPLRIPRLSNRMLIFSHTCLSIYHLFPHTHTSMWRPSRWSISFIDLFVMNGFWYSPLWKEERSLLIGTEDPAFVSVWLWLLFNQMNSFLATQCSKRTLINSFIPLCTLQVSLPPSLALPCPPIPYHTQPP